VPLRGQDSVGFALEIDIDTKGLRSPHKLKFAVSAAPECAEAQSKDVGVIATEKGWNLYVCGQRRHEAAPRRTAGIRPG